MLSPNNYCPSPSPIRWLHEPRARGFVKAYLRCCGSLGVTFGVFRFVNCRASQILQGVPIIELKVSQLRYSIIISFIIPND